MTINRGPPGYKMVHADVTECETFTGINENGFFVFGNQLNNGFQFQESFSFLHDFNLILNQSHRTIFTKLHSVSLL